MVLMGGRRKTRRGGSKCSVKKGGAKARSRKTVKNPWIEHVKKYARAHPKIRGGDLFAKAKKTYKKKK